jgi:hypothetical protein
VLETLTGGEGRVDRLIFSLATSALPEAAWESAFDLLEPGGRCVIFDVHAWRRVPQTWWTERIAQADLSRRVWAPLERCCEGFRLEKLPGSPHLHGDTPILATGDKPA